MKSRPEVIKQPVTVVIFTFVVLLCLSVVRSVVAPAAVESTTCDYSLVSQLFDGMFAGRLAWATVVSVLLATVNAVVITRIITRYSVTVVKTLIPTVLFVILSCSYLFAVGRPSTGLLLFAIVRSSEQAVGSFRRERSYGKVMSATFWLGVAVLLYPPSIVFAVAVPLVLLLYKRSAREILAGGLFFFVPLLLAEAVLWFASGELFAVTKGVVAGLGEIMTGFDTSLFAEQGINIFMLVIAGLETAMVLASIVLFGIDARDMRLRTRNINIQFIIMVLCATVMLLSGGNPAITLPVAGLCCVPLLNFFFVRCSGIFGIVIYIVLIVSTLVGIILRFI